LFIENSVLSNRELEARYEIRNEIFVKKVQIEARVLGDLAINHIIPTAIAYQNVLIKNVEGIKELMPDQWKELASHQLGLIKEISEHIHEISRKVNEMVEHRKTANNVTDIIERASLYNNNIRPYFESIRSHIDKLEMIIDDEAWPLPKYREMLFIR
ncbi:MAG TPA: glutamine synthetase type III, partial [Tenuifilaceae bacterium]|nr:glutamine synthetase type III [Tenuifilaceae bacterium]